MLPVGELTKADVRARAAELGLRTAAKAESMDVCFITKGGRESFLGARIERRPGAIVDAAGTELAHHDGIDAFTIGQRRGLAVAAGERRYVTDIAPGTGTVTIGTRDDLLRDRVSLDDVTWASGRSPNGPVLAQWRAHGTPAPASVDGNVVQFATPQPRVAPGQVVALYDGDVVLGGGIARAEFEYSRFSSHGRYLCSANAAPVRVWSARVVGATRRLQTRKADGGSVRVWSGRAVGATRRLQTRSHGPGPSYGWRARRRAAARRRTSARRVGATSTTSVSTSAPPVRPAPAGEREGRAEGDGDAARVRAQAQVEGVLERGIRGRRRQGVDLLAPHERGVDEDEGVDDHDARRHQHEPAARQPVQRRARRTAATGSPTTRATIPSSTFPEAASSGPAAIPTATSAIEIGTSVRSCRDGDAQREPVLVAVGQRIGGRNRERGASTRTAASSDDAVAITAAALEPAGVAMIVTTTATGATTRIAVRPHGRGANSATRPMPHDPHNKTAATGAADQSSSAAAIALPVVIGSTAHANRAHHSQTLCMSPTSIALVRFRVLGKPFVYYEFHAFDRARCRNGHRRRQSSASRRRRGCRARAALSSRPSGGAATAAPEPA